MMPTEIPTTVEVANPPQAITRQSRLEKVLSEKNLLRDLDFFRLRFRQWDMNPESMEEQHLRLHIDTINTMFTAHCVLPYDD